MNRIGTKGLVACLATALVLTVLLSSNLLGQFVKPNGEPYGTLEYFVTGEGDAAHLWARDGSELRCVGHGKCKTPGDNKPAGADRGKEKPKP